MNLTKDQFTKINAYFDKYGTKTRDLPLATFLQLQATVEEVIAIPSVAEAIKETGDK